MIYLRHHLFECLGFHDGVYDPSSTVCFLSNNSGYLTRRIFRAWQRLRALDWWPYDWLLRCRSDFLRLLRCQSASIRVIYYRTKGNFTIHLPFKQTITVFSGIMYSVYQLYQLPKFSHLPSRVQAGISLYRNLF